MTTDDDRVYWWTGSRTVALDALDLTPVWTLPDTLGPAVGYAGGLLVPVPAGVAVLAAGHRAGSPRPFPCPATILATPVVPAVQGEMLLEQRGPSWSPCARRHESRCRHVLRPTRQYSQTSARPPTTAAASARRGERADPVRPPVHPHLGHDGRDRGEP